MTPLILLLMDCWLELPSEPQDLQEITIIFLPIFRIPGTTWKIMGVIGHKTLAMVLIISTPISTVMGQLTTMISIIGLVLDPGQFFVRNRVPHKQIHFLISC